jgi:uncharacterized protein YjbI with pentapeptide repeats
MGEDLSGRAVAGSELSQIPRGCVSLRGSSLDGELVRETNLRDGDLRGVRLRESWLEDVNLSGADLTHAVIESARLTGVDLVGADLRRASLRGSTLRHMRRRAGRTVTASWGCRSCGCGRSMGGTRSR